MGRVRYGGGSQRGAVRVQFAACSASGRRPGAVSAAGLDGRTAGGGMGLPVDRNCGGFGRGIRDRIAGVAHRREFVAADGSGGASGRGWQGI